MRHIRLYEEWTPMDQETLKDIPFEQKGEEGHLCISKDGQWILDPINKRVKHIDDFSMKFDASSGYIEVGIIPLAQSWHQINLRDLQKRYNVIISDVKDADIPEIRADAVKRKMLQSFLRTIKVVGTSKFKWLGQLGLTPNDFTWMPVFVGVMKQTDLNI